MKKSHIALIVFPKDNAIIAIPWLRKPSKPTHSGFIDEEARIMNHYYSECKKYKEKVELGIKCDQAFALKILKEQYPDRKVLQHIKSHYDVINVTLNELLGRPKRIFAEKEMVTCVHASPLPENEIGPNLELGKEYPLRRILTDSKGNQHFDVGLESSHTYISSYETGEHLPDGDKIHWCHPSRFI